MEEEFSKGSSTGELCQNLSEKWTKNDDDNTTCFEIVKVKSEVICLVLKVVVGETVKEEEHYVYVQLKEQWMFCEYFTLSFPFFPSHK